MAIKFNLEDNEASFILQVIGQLPTQSGAFPLLQKLEGQVKEQIKEVASKSTEETPVSD